MWLLSAPVQQGCMQRTSFAGQAIRWSCSKDGTESAAGYFRSQQSAARLILRTTSVSLSTVALASSFICAKAPW